MDITCKVARCKFCSSTNVIRYGYFKTTQHLWCKDCRRKSSDNGADPNMKTPNNVVSGALGMYYDGMSVNAICRQLQRQYDNYSSNSTVYEWLRKYTNQALMIAKNYKPDVGDVWIANETILKVGGKKHCIWDILDTRTRYLIVSYINSNHKTGNAQAALELAAGEAGKIPLIILADELASNRSKMVLTSGTNAKQVAVKSMALNTPYNLIEFFLGVLRHRTIILQRLKKAENAELIINGWFIHYNYVKRQESLHNRTPSELAGVDECLDHNGLIIMKHTRETIKPWQENYFGSMLLADRKVRFPMTECETRAESIVGMQRKD